MIVVWITKACSYLLLDFIVGLPLLILIVLSNETSVDVDEIFEITADKIRTNNTTCLNWPLGVNPNHKRNEPSIQDSIQVITIFQ